jgi:predicted dehydrogenase
MKILIVGLGSIAKKHIISIRKCLYNPEIYALRSSIDSNIIDGIINIYDLDKDVIDFDFAIISNPTEYHYDFIMKLADRNINLFIEKPPVNSLTYVNDISHKIKTQNIQTYVACYLRHHPCIQYVKKHIDGNKFKVNEVNVYFGSFLPEWRPNRDFRKIYSSIPELGGGVHLDLFHELDYSYWLFGKPIKVLSTKRNVSTLNIRSIDSAVYLLEYDNFNVNITLNYFRKDSKRTIEILFENETWIIDLINNRITDNLGNIILNIENYNPQDTYDAQMKCYLENLKANHQSYPFDDSIEILKICLSND